MLIRIDFESDVPIYVQLFNEIVEGIASGQLQPGEPLPSVRSLAQDLGINLHTVNKAYTNLKQEGYVLIHRQRGALINPDPLPDADEAFIRKLEANLRPLAAEAVCRRVSEEQLQELLVKLYQQIREGRQES